MPVEVFENREKKRVNYNKEREKGKGQKSAAGQDLNAPGRETDKQIEASRDRRGRQRWMSRFRGQEIRGEIKAWRNRRKEGGREAAAAYNVYMHQYVVEHVCLLMSLAVATEHAHTPSR